jgi:hypothetical protein
MKVKELISLLANVDPEIEVVLAGFGDYSSDVQAVDVVALHPYDREEYQPCVKPVVAISSTVESRWLAFGCNW